MKSNQFSIKNVSNHLFSSETIARARLPFVTIEWIQTRRPDLLVDTQIYEWSIDSQNASHVNMQQAIALPFILFCFWCVIWKQLRESLFFCSWSSDSRQFLFQLIFLS